MMKFVEKIIEIWESTDTVTKGCVIGGLGLMGYGAMRAHREIKECNEIAEIGEDIEEILADPTA